MKKIFLLPLILFYLFFTQLTSFAQEQNNIFANPLNFNNETYYLKYARTSSEATINEYVRKNESVHKWNKLIAVRYYNTTIKLKKFIKETYGSIKDDYVPISIECDDNVALVSFIMIGPNYIEYNNWKYIVTDKNIVAIQYAKKFNFTKKTTVQNIMKRIQTHHNEIAPIMNKDLTVAVEFTDIGED